jgi:acyl-homoserine lactone acylase PvdQ
VEQPKPPPHAAQTTGTVQVQAARAGHGDARSRGIPHIVAANTEDLFFAQGFVS